MNDKFDIKTRKYAFNLWLAGEPKKDICEKVGISYKTLGRWIEKYNWEQEKYHCVQKVQTEVAIDMVEFKKIQLSEIRQIQQDMAEVLKDCSNPSKDKIYQQMIELKKIELAILGISSDSKQVAVKEDVTVTHKLEDFFK